MRIKKSVYCCMILLVTAYSTIAWARPAATRFLQGVDAYEQSHFQEAVDIFLPLAESGVENGYLFYNLGNAYLKAEQLGHAIYWYERAMSFIPRNTDLRYNLEYAKSLAVDDQPAGKGIVTRVFFFWEDILSARTIQFVTIGSTVVFWLGFGLMLFRASPWAKGMVLSGAVIFMVLAPTAVFQLYHASLAPQGIILPSKAPVRSGRSTTATELFILHAGTRVDVLERTHGYAKIIFRENMFGWIDQDDLGIL